MASWIAEGLHRTAIGHLVPADACVPSLRSRDPETTLQVGRNATIQGALALNGAIVLAPGVSVWAGIRGGHEVVIGPRCHIQGDVQADGRIVVQDGARIDGTVTAGSDAHLLGACHVGDVTAAGDIFIVGAPQTGRLDPGGRIQTRPW